MAFLVGTAAGLHEVGDEERFALAGHSVTALARGPGAVWAVLDGRDVWADRGDGWTEIASSPDLALRSIAVAPEAVLVGTERARLFRVVGERLAQVEPFDHVEGREGWYTPWGGPPDTRSIAVGAGGDLFVNVHVGGIPRSVDGGRTWLPTIEVDADVHQVIAHREDPTTALAATALGLAVSRDGGASWSFATEGLHASYCRAVVLTEEGVLVSASVGPRGGRAAVYRGALGGGELERCREGLPEWFPDNVDSHCLATAGDTAAFGTRAGEVFVSDDGGRTWELVAEGLPEVRCVVGPAG